MAAPLRRSSPFSVSTSMGEGSLRRGSALHHAARRCRRGCRLSPTTRAGTRARRARGGDPRLSAGRRSFAKMLVTCFSTARSGDHEPLGDRLVRAALGHQLEHLALARRQLLERIVAAAPADELRDDGRVERRAALGDAAHRRGELVHVGDAVLQQVADALGALAEQLHRVGRLDVLRQDEHARSRASARGSPSPRAAPRRSASAACGCRRARRPACACGPSAAARRRSRSGATTSKPRVLEQPRDPLAQQDGVVREHDAHAAKTSASCAERAETAPAIRPP